jgi:putative transposase
MAQRKAPRKKKEESALAKELRSARVTVVKKACNRGKLKEVRSRLDFVRVYKNKISQYVREHFEALLADQKAFVALYAEFNGSGVLNAWETQTLFHSICGDYLCAWDQRTRFYAPFVQDGVTFERYKRRVTVKSKKTGLVLLQYLAGAPKPSSFDLKRQRTPLTRVVAYLFKVRDPAALDVAGIKNECIRETIVRLQAEPAKWARVVALSRAARARYFAKVKLHHYRTGTHAIEPTIGSSGLIHDPVNKEHQWFLEVRITDKKKDGHIRLPVLFNRKRMTPELLRRSSAFLLKDDGKKIHAIFTYEAETPVFKAPGGKVLALDANSKNNLMQDSDGRAYLYDRTYLKQLIEQAKDIEKIGYHKLDYKQKAQFTKLIRRNEWKLKTLLSEWVKDWVEDGVTDIVLEDLALSKDATFLKDEFQEVKYSRLVRLLRLSALKDWLKSMCEKQGIRVHTTHAAYTSQECPKCHAIDRRNRVVQEKFKCVECGHEENADTNAAVNIRARVTDDVLKSLLHDTDEHGRLTPKPMRYREVKGVLTKRWKSETRSGTEHPGRSLVAVSAPHICGASEAPPL